MYTAKIKNASDETLTLSGAEADYQIISIAGLNPPTAQINTSTISGLDGAVFNSAKLETRNIVITVRINGNVEQNRHRLYNFCRTKEKCTFFFKNTTLDVFADGYVNSFECDLFSQSEIAQISIICVDPCFHGVEPVSVDSSTSSGQMFTFPFSIEIGEPIVFSDLDNTGTLFIYNDSDAETGVTVSVLFSAAANQFRIANSTTGGVITLDYSFQPGDMATISTTPGAKGAKLTRDGMTTNLFPAISENSVFFQLAPGANRIEYTVDGSAGSDDDIFVYFSFLKNYRGV